jgi:hypothetical protein
VAKQIQNLTIETKQRDAEPEYATYERVSEHIAIKNQQLRLRKERRFVVTLIQAK